MVTHLDAVAAVQWYTHGAFDAHAVDPHPVAGGVNHNRSRELGIYSDFEMIAGDGEIVAEQNPMSVVDASAFAADEEPVE